VERDLDRDYFMTADEAKEYGLIDDIIEPRRGLAFTTPAAVAS
jgi:ATP-dependent Clp protease protease subunit